MLLSLQYFLMFCIKLWSEKISSEFELFFSSHTWVVLQYSPMIILANGSDRPDASEPMRDRAWYMCARTWKNFYTIKHIFVWVQENHIIFWSYMFLCIVNDHWWRKGRSLSIQDFICYLGIKIIRVLHFQFLDRHCQLRPFQGFWITALSCFWVFPSLRYFWCFVIVRKKTKLLGIPVEDHLGNFSYASQILTRSKPKKFKEIETKYCNIWEI